jgi:Ni,Fe-hydrogenase maturation factor
MTPPRILVAGVGNVLWGDDGFGVAVVRSLAQRTCPRASASWISGCAAST